MQLLPISRNRSTYVVSGIMALFAIASVVFVPELWALATLESLTRELSIVTVVALGLTFVIAVNRFDLSLTGVATLAAMSAAFVVSHGYGAAIAIILGLTIGVVCGLLNGLMIGYGDMPDLVTTVGLGAIGLGLGYAYSNGGVLSDHFLTSGITTLYSGSIFGIPAPFLILCTVVGLTYYALHMTTVGQKFYAIGENETAALYSGVSKRFYILAAFTICGLGIGLGAVLNTSARGGGYISAGARFLLPAYTAVYLGTALSRRPGVLPTLIGSVIMAFLSKAFTLLSVPFYFREIIVGVILVLAILFASEQWRRHFTQHRSREQVTKAADPKSSAA